MNKMSFTRNQTILCLIVVGLLSVDAFGPSALHSSVSSGQSLQLPTSRLARSRLLRLNNQQDENYIIDAEWVGEESSPSMLQDDLARDLILNALTDISSQSIDEIERELLIEKTPFISVKDPVLSPNLTDEVFAGPTHSDEMDNVNAVLAASSEAVRAASLQTELPIEDLTVQPAVVEEKTVRKIEAPSVTKILRFAIPAMGVWLCGPLLSLIDTSSVGILSGTVQQAALNPAVAVTDYGALLISFLFTGTTNMVASAQEEDRTVEGSPRTAKTLIGAMQFSTFVGAGLGAILFIFARSLLSAMVGNGGVGPEVFDAAMKYVRIRALGMPAAAIIGSAQAASLGMQDIKSPLFVLAAAAVVNFMGDMLFVGSTNPWIGGAAGAAWATVFSQYAAVAFFMRWLCHKPKRNGKADFVNLSKPIMELTTASTIAGEERRQRFRDAVKDFGRKATKPIRRLSHLASSALKAEEAEEYFSVRGFLHNRFDVRSLARFPPRDTIEEFSPYILPVTTTQVGRVSGYVAMSHVVSSSLGTVSMAAQQVIVSLFYCLCPLADSLSLTSQSFVPAIFGKKDSEERARALRKLLVNFGKAAGAFGLILVAAGASVPLVSHFFTSDPIVVSHVNRVVPFLMGIFAVHGFVCAGEGILLGQKDLAFLGRMYAAFFTVVPLLMLRVKRAALTGSQAVDLTSVWKVFLGYQLFRAASWVSRVMVLQRRTEKKVKAL